MYACHYVHENQYAYKMKHNVTVDSMLNLSCTLSVPNAPIEDLLYTKLAQGVSQILAHFVKNFSVNLYVLVFICLKYLALNTTATRELKVIRLLF